MPLIQARTAIFVPIAMSKVKTAETPLMQQHKAIKAKYPDAILLFRVGDFYETFGQDAVIASQVLGITLTKRNNGSASENELAGFPHHALDTYLHKLVKAGYRVAICDQLEDPKTVKGIVKRGDTLLMMEAVSFISTMKVLSPALRLSDAPTRVKILSVKEMCASLAGTKLPV